MHKIKDGLVKVAGEYKQADIRIELDKYPPLHNKIAKIMFEWCEKYGLKGREKSRFIDGVKLGAYLDMWGRVRMERDLIFDTFYELRGAELQLRHDDLPDNKKEYCQGYIHSKIDFLIYTLKIDSEIVLQFLENVDNEQWCEKVVQNIINKPRYNIDLPTK